MLISMALSVVCLWLFAHTQRSLPRHLQQMDKRQPLSAGKCRLMRATAWLLLLLAWHSAANSIGVQLGSLFLIAELGVAGLIVTVLLALRYNPVPL